MSGSLIRCSKNTSDTPNPSFFYRENKKLKYGHYKYVQLWTFNNSRLFLFRS